MAVAYLRIRALQPRVVWHVTHHQDHTAAYTARSRSALGRSQLLYKFAGTESMILLAVYVLAVDVELWLCQSLQGYCKYLLVYLRLLRC